MLRRYELTDSEWERLSPLLPSENTGKPGRPSKDNRLMLNAMIWLARSAELLGGIFRNVTALGKRYTAVFVNGLMMESLNISSIN